MVVGITTGCVKQVVLQIRVQTTPATLQSGLTSVVVAATVVVVVVVVVVSKRGSAQAYSGVPHEYGHRLAHFGTHEPAQQSPASQLHRWVLNATSQYPSPAKLSGDEQPSLEEGSLHANDVKLPHW